MKCWHFAASRCRPGRRPAGERALADDALARSCALVLACERRQRTAGDAALADRSGLADGKADRAQPPVPGPPPASASGAVPGRRIRDDRSGTPLPRLAARGLAAMRRPADDLRPYRGAVDGDSKAVAAVRRPRRALARYDFIYRSESGARRTAIRA